MRLFIICSNEYVQVSISNFSFEYKTQFIQYEYYFMFSSSVKGTSQRKIKILKCKKGDDLYFRCIFYNNISCMCTGFYFVHESAPCRLRKEEECE